MQEPIVAIDLNEMTKLRLMLSGTMEFDGKARTGFDGRHKAKACKTLMSQKRMRSTAHFLLFRDITPEIRCRRTGCET